MLCYHSYGRPVIYICDSLASPPPPPPAPKESRYLMVLLYPSWVLGPVMGVIQKLVSKGTPRRESSVGGAPFHNPTGSFSTHLHHSPKGWQDSKGITGQVQQGLLALSCPVRCVLRWVLEEDPSFTRLELKDLLFLRLNVRGDLPRRGHSHHEEGVPSRDVRSWPGEWNQDKDSMGDGTIEKHQEEILCLSYTLLNKEHFLEHI